MLSKKSNASTLEWKHRVEYHIIKHKYLKIYHFLSELYLKTFHKKVVLKFETKIRTFTSKRLWFQIMVTALLDHS